MLEGRLAKDYHPFHARARKLPFPHLTTPIQSSSPPYTQAQQPTLHSHTPPPATRPSTPQVVTPAGPVARRNQIDPPRWKLAPSMPLVGRIVRPRLKSQSVPSPLPLIWDRGPELSVRGLLGLEVLRWGSMGLGRELGRDCGCWCRLVLVPREKGVAGWVWLVAERGGDEGMRRFCGAALKSVSSLCVGN